MLLTMSALDVAAQDCATIRNPPTPRPPGASCQMFGAVMLESFQSPEWTSASVRTRLQGKSSDVVPGPNATIRVLDDVLNFTLGFWTRHHFVPEEVSIEITSYSPLPFKYAKNNDLTIVADDVVIISENMELLLSNAIADRLLLRIKYSDFLMLADARKASLKLGSTEIELNPDVVRALRVLSEFTKQLKPAPPRVQQSCI